MTSIALWKANPDRRRRRRRLHNDSDSDGDPLTATRARSPRSVHFALTAPSSTLRTLVSTGVDTFTYRASDGTSESAEATVTLVVTPLNGAPVAVSDQYTTAEDEELIVNAAEGVLHNDSDTEGDSLTAEQMSQPAHGTLNFNSDGSFSYVPDAGFFGSDQFHYRTSDGTSDSAVATVTVTVTEVNEVPLASDDQYSATEDTERTIDAAEGVLHNDSDGDGDTLSVELVTQATHGTVQLESDGSFSYTPDDNFFGTDQFSYRVSDGTTPSAPATVTMTVTSVNDRPVAVNDQYDATADDPLNIGIADGVLQNDSDADGDSFTAQEVTGPRMAR